MNQQESIVETVNNAGNNEDRTEMQQIYLQNVIPPICFHLNRAGKGNDDISTENHLKPGKVLIFYLYFFKYLNSVL